MNSGEWWQNKKKADRKKSDLADYYDNLTSPIDLLADYVYVALSYQPERSTSPLAGQYVNPFLMIDLLSKSIPPGWLLYIKEHPFQYTAFGHGERSRNRWFYDDLVSLPNVRLVPLTTPQFDLIDNAKAVANAGLSTPGWEAVTRGRPALSFGYPWFMGCEGVFDARTEDSCREALEQIAEGYRVDQTKVRLFIKALENVTFRGFIDAAQGREAEISTEENVVALTQALIGLGKSRVVSV